MRTFHNLELVREVIENTTDTIGQRNYGLFKCYQMPFDRGLSLRYNEKHKDVYEKIPSIEEFVTRQIGEENNKTVLFDYYIGLESEDLREHFELCFRKIMEYEANYPIDEIQYSYNLKENLEMDFKQNLKQILKRPGMFGMFNISYLRAYIDGHFSFKKKYNLNLSRVEQNLLEFVDYWKSQTNESRPFETWDRPFRFKRMGTTDFSHPNGNWEFKRFEEIIVEDLNIEFD